MTFGSETYLTAARSVLDRVAAAAASQVPRAADLIVAGLRRGGIVQAFGTGHSQALAMEIAGRAGGLVPTNMLALRDVAVFGGEPWERLLDPLLERDAEVSRRVYELAGTSPEDVFVIFSNSGVNGSIVEMACQAREHGQPVIAITSLEHTSRVTPVHPSGKRLCELADVVLDNGAPLGDALLPLPGGGAACPISLLSGGLLVEMLIAEVIGRLLAAGEEPPVYVSNNVPGGLDRNNGLEERYGGRIRRSI